MINIYKLKSVFTVVFINNILKNRIKELLKRYTRTSIRLFEIINHKNSKELIEYSNNMTC